MCPPAVQESSARTLPARAPRWWSSTSPVAPSPRRLFPRSWPASSNQRRHKAPHLPTPTSPASAARPSSLPSHGWESHRERACGGLGEHRTGGHSHSRSEPVATRVLRIATPRLGARVGSGIGALSPPWSRKVSAIGRSQPGDSFPNGRSPPTLVTSSTSLTSTHVHRSQAGSPRASDRGELAPAIQIIWWSAIHPVTSPASLVEREIQA